MPRMSDHEEYLDATMVGNGDIVVLLDEGVFREPEETGLSRTVFQIRVGLPDQRRKTWTMNKTTRRNLAKAYGDDSANWVNKRVRIQVLQQNVRGEVKDVLYGHPVEGGPATQQKVVTDRADKIIDFILRTKPTLTWNGVKMLVEKEQKQAVGLLTEEAAAYLVARNLGVDLEPTGQKIV